MDFARKQLEKYGWTDGKGLGKNENGISIDLICHRCTMTGIIEVFLRSKKYFTSMGISEALKPKLKRSVAGVGHDPAAEFNEHWWTALYDKAAGNVEVKEKNGKTKKITTKDNDNFVITNSTWKLNKKPKDPENEEQYSDYFVRTAVLTNGINSMERIKESDTEDEGEKKDVFKMTDEELFAACEGRTAHKGARHGLKATGKLARIAQQEALLLKESKYNGYSHAKKLKEKVAEEMNLNSDSEITGNKRKKKKRKRCNSNEKCKDMNSVIDEVEPNNMPLPQNHEENIDGSVANTINNEKHSRKHKKSKKKDFRDIEVIIEEDEDVSIPKKKKKRDTSPEPMETNDIEETASIENMKRKRKKNKTMES